MFWIGDCLIGAATACGLVYGTAMGRASVWVRLLSVRALVQLGVISYSLYLIHDPLLAMERVIIAKLGLSPFAAFGTMVALGVPAILLITVVFHLCFERPFMSRRRIGDAAPPTVPTVQPIAARAS